MKPKDSKEKGAPINVRPFWVCPKELLLHNMVLASQINVVDARMLTTNAMTHAGITVMAGQFSVQGVNGAALWLGFNLGMWLLWLNGPHSVRKMLTSPELMDAVLF
jgi:hypothetical protein